MTTRRGARIRAFRNHVLVLTALCALVVGLSQTVDAAPKRSATASPASELGDQVVKVEWKGFRPTRADGTFSVDILQCIAKPKSVNKDCNTAETFPYALNGNQQHGVTARDGTGSVFMDIMTSARMPALACSETHPCSLMLIETTANGYNPAGLPKVRVMVPLRFERSATDCPPVTNFDFRMETEPSAAPALYEWATHFCTGTHRFTIDITSSASNAAREDFLEKEVDIAVTSLRPKPTELKKHKRPFAVAPIDLTAVVFAYNITDPDTEKQITDLTLSPRLVARLLSDSDPATFFADPEFLKLNPKHSWPIEAAPPGLRAEQNADTWIVTNWIHGSKNAHAFLKGKDKYGVRVNPAWRNVRYPTDIFDARDPNGVYLPRVGEEGVAQRIFAQTNPADSIPTDPLNAGQIGILDLPTALRFKLPIAKLANGPQSPVVELNAESIAAGFAAMKTSPAGFHSMPGVSPDPAAYPLTKVDHAMVPPKLTGSPKDLRIRAFLNHAVGAGQEGLPLGYAALPLALKLQTLTYTGDLPPAPTTTTTTLPPPPPVDAGTDFTDDYTDYTDDYSDDYSSPAPVVTTPTTPPTKPVVRVKTTVKPRQTEFVALVLPDSGDRYALPALMGLALLALLACGADVAYRRAYRRARP